MTSALRVLLANEAGAGRGHIVTLKTIARAFRPGVEFDAALSRMDYAGELKPIGATVFPGVRLSYDRSRRTGPGAVHTATWGEYLADIGFSRPELLPERLAWWQQVMTSRQIRVLVADYAPMAMLAAQGLAAQGYDIQILATGTGYGLPPPDLAELPVLLPEYAERLHDERALTDGINDVAAPFGVPHLPGLAAIYRADLALVRSLPFLDPYRDSRRDTLLPPVADRAPQVAADGTEVFIYFSTEELETPGVLEAVESLPLPRRAFLPGAAPEIRDRLARSGMIVEDAPVPVDLIAKRSRLMLNAGQHGILCLGLLAGLPQLCLPQHLEQLYHARQAQAQGVARVLGPSQRDAQTLAAAITAAYHDDTAFRAARKLADRLRNSTDTDPEAALRHRLAPLVQSLDSVR